MFKVETSTDLNRRDPYQNLSSISNILSKLGCITQFP